MHPAIAPGACVPTDYDPHLSIAVYDRYMLQRELDAKTQRPALAFRDVFARGKTAQLTGEMTKSSPSEDVHQCFTCGHRSLRPLLAPKQQGLHQLGAVLGAAAMLAAKLLLVCAVVAEPTHAVVIFAAMLGFFGYLLLNSSCSALGWRTPEQKIEHLTCRGYLAARQHIIGTASVFLNTLSHVTPKPTTR